MRAANFEAMMREKNLRVKRQAVPVGNMNSRLLQLPPELRSQIWQYALLPSEGAPDPHLHVYDTILDHCPYRIRKQCLRPTIARQTALLLACRSVYHEALQYLFDPRTFVLVIQAGTPRPCPNMLPGQDLLSRYKDCSRSLGKVRDCETFLRRIRSLRIVVQPGKQPS